MIEGKELRSKKVYNKFFVRYLIDFVKSGVWNSYKQASRAFSCHLIMKGEQNYDQIGKEFRNTATKE